MIRVAIWRPAAAFLVGAVQPHAVDALNRAVTWDGLPATLQQGLAWIVVGLPLARLVVAIAGRHAWICALAAGAGSLLALAAPFAVYGLPIGLPTLRLLGIHLVLYCLAWPATILWWARRHKPRGLGSES